MQLMEYGTTKYVSDKGPGLFTCTANAPQPTWNQIGYSNVMNKTSDTSIICCIYDAVNVLMIFS